jgi:MinD-like ATPase involved in chromosome partitioning or flagellar assembly
LLTEHEHGKQAGQDTVVAGDAAADTVTPGSHAMPRARARRAFITAIASGKGGVGKTSIVTNLGHLLARHGARVCLFDADTGLANIDILLDLKKSYNLHDYLRGKCRLHDLIKHAADDLDVIPGAGGIGDFAALAPEQRQRLTDTISQLEHSYDHILIDLPAGIGEDVLYFMRAADLPVVVINEQPPSLTDSFALLRLLRQHGLNRGAGVLVNQVSDAGVARHVFARFSQAVKRLIGLNTISLGHVFDNPNVTESVLKQVAFVRLYPDSPTTASLDRMARALARKTVNPQNTKQGMASILQQCADTATYQYTEKVFNTALQHAASGYSGKQQVLDFHYALTDVCRTRFDEMLEYYDSFKPAADDQLPSAADISSALATAASDTTTVEEQIAEYKQRKTEPVPLVTTREQDKPAADLTRDEIDALMYCSHLGPYIRQS